MAQDLITQAKGGDMKPLLDALRERKDKVFAISLEGQTGVDSNVPEDTLLLEVQGAWVNGEITDEQMEQCFDAVGMR